MHIEKESTMQLLSEDERTYFFCCVQVWMNADVPSSHHAFVTFAFSLSSTYRIRFDTSSPAFTLNCY